MALPNLITPSTEASLPITRGSLAEFSRDVLGSLLQLHADHGPVAVLEDGSQRVVFSFDPAVNKQVLSNLQSYDAHFFAVRGPKRSSQRRVTCGLLGMNGQPWKRNRRLVKEPFGLKQIATYRPEITRLAEETAAGWSLGDQIDFNQEMVRYMLRVTSTLLFGMSGSDADRQLAYDVGEQIAEWGRLNHDVGVGALVPDATFSSRYEELLEFATGLESQVMEMIRRRREAPAKEARQAQDVLSILVRMNDTEGGLSDEELVGQSCVLFGAAHLTTAHSMMWTTFLLAQHPAAMQKLRETLPAADHPLTNGSSKPDPQSQFERTMREGMRLLPASAYSQRIASEPVDIGPFRSLPRGTPVIFTPLVTHRLPAIYPQPKRFDPERWIEQKPEPYKYIPFGGGPRLCIGGPLAMEIIRTSLPIFYRDRAFRVQQGADINAQVYSTMLHPTTGMPMEIVPVGEEATSSIAGNLQELVDLPNN